MESEGKKKKKYIRTQCIVSDCFLGVVYHFTISLVSISLSSYHYQTPSFKNFLNLLGEKSHPIAVTDISSVTNEIEQMLLKYLFVNHLWYFLFIIYMFMNLLI